MIQYQVPQEVGRGVNCCCWNLCIEYLYWT